MVQLYDFGQGLRQHVAVYIPSTRNTDKPLSSEEHRQLVLKAVKRLSLLFGGATAIPGEGGWYRREDGRVVIEPITVVYAFAVDISPHDAASIRRFCKVLKSILQQDAIAAQINGELFFL